MPQRSEKHEVEFPEAMQRAVEVEARDKKKVQSLPNPRARPEQARQGSRARR